MRKIIVLSFMTLDGVMQAPGGPDDESGDFKFGGWSAPYFYEADAAAGAFLEKHMKPADLLLGRKTFDSFAAFWPSHGELWPGINDITKYVMSTSLSKNNTEWNNCIFLNSFDQVKALKNSRENSTDIQVHGSSELVQTLFRHDQVNELWLKIFPITLGKGKKLFGEGTIPAAFTLTDSLITPNGVIFANYQRAGAVKTGMIGG